MKRSGPLRQVSAKRARLMRRRSKAVHEAYGDRPRCVLCEPLRAAGIVTGCNGLADDGDEIKRRSAGGSIVDPVNVRPVGRRCHEWIGDHPKRAHELGLTLKSWESHDGT